MAINSLVKLSNILKCKLIRLMSLKFPGWMMIYSSKPPEIYIWSSSHSLKVIK